MGRRRTGCKSRSSATARLQQTSPGLENAAREPSALPPSTGRVLFLTTPHQKLGSKPFQVVWARDEPGQRVLLCAQPPGALRAHGHTQQKRRPAPTKHSFTFLFPPPGTWLMLSKDPIFDCTLSLKSSFSDFTSTWPPPGRAEHQKGSVSSCGSQERNGSGPSRALLGLCRGRGPQKR